MRRDCVCLCCGHVDHGPIGGRDLRVGSCRRSGRRALGDHATLGGTRAPVAAFLAARGSREPEDLTSEVFLAVFDRLGGFRGDRAAFRSFVFSIAYRRLVDELRQRSRRGDAQQWSPETDPRRASSAEDEATARLGDRAALRLLDGLTSDQRDVMVLRVVADLTVEQVAEVLDKNVGSVKALQRRALENLRKNVVSGRTPATGPVDSRE